MAQFIGKVPGQGQHPHPHVIQLLQAIQTAAADPAFLHGEQCPHLPRPAALFQVFGAFHRLQQHPAAFQFLPVNPVQLPHLLPGQIWSGHGRLFSLLLKSPTAPKAHKQGKALEKIAAVFKPPGIYVQSIFFQTAGFAFQSPPMTDLTDGVTVHVNNHFAPPILVPHIPFYHTVPMIRMQPLRRLHTDQCAIREYAVF